MMQGVADESLLTSTLLKTKSTGEASLDVEVQMPDQ